jgi:alkylation response protein AidB-like acyl-CoA dehydrogenase
MRVPGGFRLSAAELATITPRRLVGRVEAVVPFVTAHAAEAEAQRRPVDAVVDAIHATGVFHHFVPQRYGGLEFGVMDFVDNMLPLGAADASTGWVTAFCMEHNLLLAMFPEEAQDEIFGAQPYVIAPGCAFPPGVATRVPGGFRLSGRWRYASGVMHADWALAVGLDPADPSDARWFAFPLAESTVYDVWRMDGMGGDGQQRLRRHRPVRPRAPHRALRRDGRRRLAGRATARQPDVPRLGDGVPRDRLGRADRRRGPGRGRPLP